MVDAEQNVVLEFEPVLVPEEEIIIPLQKVPSKPEVPYIPSGPFAGKKGLIFNIETAGLKPWKDRILAIGIQNPELPEENPSIIMLDDEKEMLNILFRVIVDNGYNQLIGYGLSFDYRFILIRAMYHEITCSEFYNCDLLDMGQAMAQGKFSFVYFPQKQPVLSDLAEFFWDYPKPFTDEEMMKYYAEGNYDKVVEFTSSQITRILALYLLFRYVTENIFVETASGGVGNLPSVETPPDKNTRSALTIPEASLPKMTTYKCLNCLAEYEIPETNKKQICDICGSRLQVMS